MNPSILVVIRCSLMFLVPSVTYAISAQWDLDPISGDWNTAANWTPNGVPNGPADTATFGVSNTTNVSISEDTEVNGIIFTPAATNPYTITVTDFTLTISGVGITNNPGIHQNFVTGFGSGQIRFTNSSTADNVFIENNGLGSTNFFDSSTAGLSVIFNKGGSTNFFDSSTAGPSVIFNEGGPTNFYDSSTAGISEIFSGSTNFFDRSTAGNALFITFAFEPGGLYHSSTTLLQAARVSQSKSSVRYTLLTPPLLAARLSSPQEALFPLKTLLRVAQREFRLSPFRGGDSEAST
jgi:hypothetical protein